MEGSTSFNFIVGITLFVTILSLGAYAFNFGDIQNIWGTGENIDTPKQTDTGVNDEIVENIQNQDWIAVTINIFQKAWEIITGAVISGLKNIPFLGQLIIIGEWVWTGVLFFLGLLTWSYFPDEMPFIVKLVLISPIYAGLLYVMMPLFSRILEGLGKIKEIA